MTTARFKRTTSGIIVPDSVVNKTPQMTQQPSTAPHKVKNAPLVGRVITCCVCGMSGGSLTKIDNGRYRHVFCSGVARRR